MNDWRRVSLAEVAHEVTVGFVGTMAAEYKPIGVPLLRSQNVNPHVLDMADVKYIDAEFHRRLAKSSLQAGDVVTVRTGKPGATAVIPPGLGAVNCADLVITRPGPQIDPRWLSYYFNSAASGFISAQLVGAVQQHFNVSSAKSMILTLPPLVEQQAIGEVLGALDDKIAVNNRIEYHADRLLAALFVASRAMHGWTTQPLLQVIDVTFGEPFTGTWFSQPGTGRPLIRIRDLKTFVCQVWTTESRQNETLIRGGDVVVGMDAEFRPTPWLGRDGLLNQRVCRMRSAQLGDALVREVVRHPLDVIERAKSATTVIHLNKADLARSTVVVPSVAAIDQFRREADSLYAYRVRLALERAKLGELRNTLLPPLMSGRLRVRDAEKQVEAVV